MGILHVTEPRLVDQKNNILKEKWLLDLELKVIQTNIEDIRHGEVGLESEGDEGWFSEIVHERHDVFMKECLVVLEV